MIISKKRVSFRKFKKGIYEPDQIVPAYTFFAKHYDEVMIYLNYPLWRDYILEICRYFKIQNRRLLELASGTGHLANYLQTYFDVTPSDYSEEMLKNLKINYEYLDPIKIDMTDFTFEEKFGIIVSFNDNVNYITQDKKLENHFKCVYNTLKSPGIFIFDSTPLLNVKKNFLGKPFIQKNKHNYFRWQNYLYEKEKLVKSYIDILDIDEDTIYREIHRQKIHSPDLIISLLKKTGFKKIFHFEGFTMKPPALDSEHYHFAAVV